MFTTKQIVAGVALAEAAAGLRLGLEGGNCINMNQKNKMEKGAEKARQTLNKAIKEVKKKMLKEFAKKHMEGKRASSEELQNARITRTEVDEKVKELRIEEFAEQLDHLDELQKLKNTDAELKAFQAELDKFGITQEQVNKKVKELRGHKRPTALHIERDIKNFQTSAGNEAAKRMQDAKAKVAKANKQ